MMAREQREARASASKSEDKPPAAVIPKPLADTPLRKQELPKKAKAAEVPGTSARDKLKPEAKTASPKETGKNLLDKQPGNSGSPRNPVKPTAAPVTPASSEKAKTAPKRTLLQSHLMYVCNWMVFPVRSSNLLQLRLTGSPAVLKGCASLLL